MTARSIQELESALRRFADDFGYPETPPMAQRVAQRVRREPDAHGRGSRWRTVLVGVVAVSLLVVGTMIVSPRARQAVADWVGIDGIRITFDDDAVDRDVVGGGLYLGEPVAAREAAQSVSFDIAIPGELGEPDSYFVMTSVDGGEVSLVWEPTTGLPESEHSGVGAVLTQFRGRASLEMLKKVADPRTSVTAVTVDGSPGFFVTGAAHLVVRQPSGEDRMLPPRLAGNTLLWERGDVSYRLEAEVELARALEIAESLRN